MVRREYPEQVKRPLKAKRPEIYSEVVELIRFARHSRLLVTSGLVKSCARKAADNNGIHDFSPSNGWLRNFQLRLLIEPSFKLHGKEDSELPPTTAARTQEIRDTVSKYSPAMCIMWMNLDCSTARVRHVNIYWLKRIDLRLVAHQCRSTKTVSQSFCVSIPMDHINALLNILENQDLQLH